MVPRKFGPARVAGLFGLLCSAFLALGVLVPALGYSGKTGEAYSFLNHYISELGELGVSGLAWLFNASLMLGGLCLLPFSVLLGRTMRRNGWAKAGAAAGSGAAIFLILVGCFPMNRIAAHTLVAMWFFRLGLVMILLFTVAVFRQPRGEGVLPKWVNIAGALSVAAFVIFLFVVPRLARMPAGALDPSVFPVRPSPLWMAASEWGIYFTTIVWILEVSLVLSIRSRRSGEA